MNESTKWERRQYLALLAVLAFHMIVLAVLVMASRTRSVDGRSSEPLELLVMAPPPKVRVDDPRARRISGIAPLAIAPPVLDTPSAPASSSAGSTAGGSGIDWAAEARRALQAFEIRGHQPPSDSAAAISPADDDWWPAGRHRAGDRYKTDTGDWIVWIDSNCYQVATAGGSPYAPGATPPQTRCLGESGAPRGNP